MALLFADGFEDGTSAWTLSNLALGAGRFGQGLVSSISIAWGQMNFGLKTGTIIVGFAVNPTGASDLLWLQESGFDQLVLQRGSGGDLTLRGQGGTSGSVIGTAPAATVPASAWSYVELKATIADLGAVTVRVNGVAVITVTNVDVKASISTGANTIRIGNLGAGTIVDDVYICDGTGTYNNDFVGEIQVEHLRPASDDTAQWVGSDGNSTNNWDLVDEVGAYNGADYVGSSTVGQRDLYVPTASSRGTSSPVAGVIVTAVTMKTDSGTRTAKLAVKEGAGGTVRYGSDTGLATSFGEIRSVFERKGDSSQFTVADVNALRFGIEVAT